MTKYRIEPHNYERFFECFKETFVEDLLKPDNKDALIALLELLTGEKKESE